MTFLPPFDYSAGDGGEPSPAVEGVCDLVYYVRHTGDCPRFTSIRLPQGTGCYSEWRRLHEPDRKGGLAGLEPAYSRYIGKLDLHTFTHLKELPISQHTPKERVRMARMLYRIELQPSRYIQLLMFYLLDFVFKVNYNDYIISFLILPVKVNFALFSENPPIKINQ